MEKNNEWVEVPLNEKKPEKVRDFIVYPWKKVAQTANQIFLEMNPKKKYIFDNPLNEIYNNNLPHFMIMIFAKAFVDGYDREREDFQILINAQKQLNCDGWIGNRDSDD